jgi:hypothetical protein
MVGAEPEISSAASVPTCERISTGRRPTRSDHRPSQGEAKNCAAK